MAGNSTIKKTLDCPIGREMGDGTVYAGTSPVLEGPFFTLRENFTMAESGILVYTHDDAVEFANDIRAHGYNDWRLPHSSELIIMYNARSAIGGFVKDEPQNYVWGASEHPTRKDKAYVLDFNTGVRGWDFKTQLASLRPVRGTNYSKPSKPPRSAFEWSWTNSDHSLNP
jgi:hypothetical protein